jgi:hypothetical protein
MIRRLCVVAVLWMMVGCEPAGSVAQSARALAAGGLLFANYCQANAGTLHCAPVRFDLGGAVTGTVHATPLAPLDPKTDAPVGVTRMHGSGADASAGTVVWQAACAPNLYVTDVPSGRTRTVPTLTDGVCLSEWVQVGDKFVVLGGPALASGQVAAASAYEVTAAGQVRMSDDLRGKLDGAYRFNHPFQSNASFDPIQKTITTTVVPLKASAAGEQQLQYRVSDGAVAVVAGGGPLQHQFYDRELGRTLYWNCDLAAVSDEKGLKIPLGPLADIGAANTTEVCYQGFLGAAYDAATQHYYVLFRRGQVRDPADTLVLGVFALAERRFDRFVRTDASFAMFGIDGDSGFQTKVRRTFFLPVEFVAARP